MHLLILGMDASTRVASRVYSCPDSGSQIPLFRDRADDRKQKHRNRALKVFVTGIRISIRVMLEILRS